MITIHITAEDISHGIVRSSRFCPVARAIERAIHERCPFPVFVFVYLERIVISSYEFNDLTIVRTYDTIPVPKAIQIFVIAFDTFTDSDRAFEYAPYRATLHLLAPQSFELPGLEEALVKIYRYYDSSPPPPAIPETTETPVPAEEPELVEA